MSNYNIGIKIWSINKEAFPKIKDLYNKGIIQYVEIYIVPGSFDANSLELLRGIPVIFHGPKWSEKFNLVNHDDIFLDSINTINKFVKFFDENLIIFHPGIGTDDDEFTNKIIDNIRFLQNKGLDVILENVPKIAMDYETKLFGYSYEVLKTIIDKTGCKFCLDVGHAIAASNSIDVPIIENLDNLLSLNPYMIHVCDGKADQIVDHHMDIGLGSFNLTKILQLIKNSFSDRNLNITIETPKDDYIGLKQDINNLNKLRTYL